MEYKYRVSPLGNVFRKAKEGFVSQQMAEEFNFRDKAWKVTWSAEDAFYDSTDSYEVTKEEAEKHIADVLKKLGGDK